MATPARTDLTASAAVNPRGGGGANAVAPRARGAIETYAWRDGRKVTIRAGVRAYGHRYRIDFATNHEGWSFEPARPEREGVLQQVERGTWGAAKPKTSTQAPRSTPRRPAT